MALQTITELVVMLKDIDMSKAFHTDDSIAKLNYYGFNNSSLDLMISYLSNRYQNVNYDETQC